MSVVTSIRDYIEVLNTQIGEKESPGSFFSLVLETFPHILKICGDFFWYVFSFKGLRDNFYQLYLGSFEENSFKLFIDNGFGSHHSIENLLSNITSQNLSFFFYGFGNSFFLSLPGSIGTLMILRRVIVQGIPAGIASTIGSVLGSCFIMIFATAGNSFTFLSPVYLDIAFYLSLVIPSYIVVRAIWFSNFRIIPSRDIKSLISIGFIHFLLGVSNESTLFKHIRDLTIAPYPTRFLGISSLQGEVLYVLGFICGSVLFAFSILSLMVFGVNWWLNTSIMSRSRFMNLSENISIVLLTALSLTSLSYYGADFLVTKSSGFLPIDQSFSETVLAPNTLRKHPSNYPVLRSLYPSLEFSLDPAPFDRPLEKLARNLILVNQLDSKYRSFEELNYQGEKHWLHRQFRHKSAKPIKTSTLPAEKSKLARGRALLRSLDKAVGWVDEDQKTQNKEIAFSNLANEEIEFNFLPPDKLQDNTDYAKYLGFLEEKFKSLFFGQIGLVPNRRLLAPYGPFNSQEMAHKRLAFTNPVYKALLSFDIDLFLKRQPLNQSLSTQDEHNIFLKRQLVERYINTQRDYFDNLGERKVQKTNEIGFESDEPKNFIKSLANQTYKHQFKGTLEIVRQMFAVSLDCPDPVSVAGGGSWERLMNEKPNFLKDDKEIIIPRPQNPRVLKFDQPLYTRQRKVNTRVGKKEQLQLSSNQKAKNKQNPSLKRLPFIHEELYSENNLSHKGSLSVNSQNLQNKLDNAQKKEQKPFLESTTISPFYIGWDNNNRQLLLTQRYLTRKNALSFNFQQSSKNEDIKDNFKATRNKEKDFQKAFSENKNAVKGENSDLEFIDNVKSEEGFYIGKSHGRSFTSWPLRKLDNQVPQRNWRMPSFFVDQMRVLESIKIGNEAAQIKGLGNSYEKFQDRWNKFFPNASGTSSFKVNYWPTNITTPAVQTDLDYYQLSSVFTGIKGGGFIWPGSFPLELKK